MRSEKRPTTEYNPSETRGGTTWDGQVKQTTLPTTSHLVPPISKENNREVDREVDSHATEGVVCQEDIIANRWDGVGRWDGGTAKDSEIRAVRWLSDMVGPTPLPVDKILTMGRQLGMMETDLIRAAEFLKGRKDTRFKY